MNSSVWNVRGGGGRKSTQQQLWYLRNKLKLNILVILEPMVKLERFYFCAKFKMDKVVANSSNKIWVFSDENYVIEVLEDHVQFLHCKVMSD